MKASILSSIPPYSPNKRLLCLTLQNLFMQEIERSPHCDDNDKSTPRVSACTFVSPINPDIAVKIIQDVAICAKSPANVLFGLISFAIKKFFNFCTEIDEKTAEIRDFIYGNYDCKIEMETPEGINLLKCLRK